MGLINKIREFINPPYKTRDLLAMIGTALLLLSISITVYAIKNRNVVTSEAVLPPDGSIGLYGYISGRIFKDDNANGYKNSGEKFITYYSSCAGYYNRSIYVKALYHPTGTIGIIFPISCDSTGPFYSKALPFKGVSGEYYTYGLYWPSGWVGTGNSTKGYYLYPKQSKNIWFGVKKQ